MKNPELFKNTEIGSIVSEQEKDYQVVKWDTCNGCAFFESKCDEDACRVFDRPDKKDVKFIEIK